MSDGKIRDVGDDTATSVPSRPRSERRIGPWGSVARLVVGIGAVAAALVAGPSPTEIVAGLVVLPAIELAVLLVLRRPGSAPLRIGGGAGHAVNWAVGIVLFVASTEAALLFYGASILLAFVRGYAGCEIFAISNWLRRRDDQIVCPIFSPIDSAEARRDGSVPR